MTHDNHINFKFYCQLFFCNSAMLICSGITCGFFRAVRPDMCSGDRPDDPQSLEHLVSGLLQEKLTDPCVETFVC